MKEFLYHVFFLLLVCAVLSNCKHEPVINPNGPQCGEATTIDEMMEWVYFKTGTYWIYEEQNTGSLDTITVYFDYSGTSNTGNREFLVKMRSSLDGYTYEYWFNDAWSTESSLRPGCIIRAIDCDKYIPGDAQGGNHVFPFPLFVGNRVYQWHGLESGPTRITNFLVTETIQAMAYDSVYTISQTFSPQHSYAPSEYQMAKNNGIVKKILPDSNQTWELIESNIMQ